MRGGDLDAPPREPLAKFGGRAFSRDLRRRDAAPPSLRHTDDARIGAAIGAERDQLAGLSALDVRHREAVAFGNVDHDAAAALDTVALRPAGSVGIPGRRMVLRAGGASGARRGVGRSSIGGQPRWICRG